MGQMTAAGQMGPEQIKRMSELMKEAGDTMGGMGSMVETRTHGGKDGPAGDQP